MNVKVMRHALELRAVSHINMAYTAARVKEERRRSLAVSCGVWSFLGTRMGIMRDGGNRDAVMVWQIELPAVFSDLVSLLQEP